MLHKLNPHQQLCYKFPSLVFVLRTLLSPLFEDAVCARISSEFSRAVEVFARTPDTGWAAVGVSHADPRGGAGTTGGVFHMPPQVLL
jgi:hypothetical protein